MWKFYLRAIRKLPHSFADSFKKIEGGIALAFFVVLILSKPLGQRLMNWDSGIDPRWALIPVSLLFVWSALKANYALYVAQGQKYEDEIKKLVSKGATRAYDSGGFTREWAQIPKKNIEAKRAALIRHILEFVVSNGPRFDNRHGYQVVREFKSIFSQPIIELLTQLGEGHPIPAIYFDLENCHGEHSIDSIANNLRKVGRPRADDSPP